MKEKIIIFLVGLLLGAVISTGSIYVYTKANNINDERMHDNKNQIKNENMQPEFPNDNQKNNHNFN